MIVKEVQQQCITHGRDLIMTFIDIKKAYDWIDRSTLWTTLLAYGFDDHVLRLIQALYLEECYACVGGRLVERQFRTAVGVRQGCLLSPLLFNLVVDRALRSVVPRMCGIEMTTKDQKKHRFTVRAYADDMVLFSPQLA